MAYSDHLMRQYDEAYKRYREARDRLIPIRPYEGGSISSPRTPTDESIENVVALHATADQLHVEWIRSLREGR